MAEDDLDDLEEELAELEDELADLEGDDAPEPAPEPETDASDASGDEGGGLVGSVRDRIAGDDEPEPADEPDEAPEEPPEDPEPVGEEPAEPGDDQETPWDREGGSWRAEGEAAGDDDTVIVRRLDEDGNVVEEERATSEVLPGSEPDQDDEPEAVAAAAGGGNPPPEPADEDDDDGGGGGWLVLLLVGILVLAVVGAGIAYVFLGEDGGVGGGSEGPSAEFTRSPTGTVATGTEIAFDASGSTVPDGASATYEWDFGDGTTARGEDARHVYSSSGTFTVTLTVTADGQRSSVSKDVTVAEAPTASVTVLVNGSEAGTDNPVLNGTEVTLSAADSSADGGISSYEWTIAGESASGAQVARTFPDPGAVSVELTVTSSEGFTDTASVTLGVGYETSFSGTLPAAVGGPSQGPAHNFTVGHAGLTASLVRGTLNYTTGTGGPLQDPTPAQLNVTDAADRVAGNATGSDGLAVVEVSNPGVFAPGQWSGRAEQAQGGAQKSYTLTVLVVYPTG